MTTSSVWSRKQWAFRVGLPIVLSLLVFGGPVEQLLLGWLYFPLRVAPKTSADWPVAILGCVSFVVFVAMLHSTFRWFFREVEWLDSINRLWSFRSTLVVASSVFLMFGAGTAMVGATHQVVWLLSGKPGRPEDAAAKQQRKLVSVLDVIIDARDAARKTEAKNSLKWNAMSMANYIDGFGAVPAGGVMDQDGNLLHGWGTFTILSGFYTADVDLGIPWNQAPNDQVFKCELRDFVNPSLSGPYFDDRGFGLSHFSANLHVLPIRSVVVIADSRASLFDWRQQWENKRQVLKLNEIKDGGSNTLLIGTVVDRFKPWGHPANVRDPALGINRAPEGFGGPTNWKGAMFALCDGSVRMISEQTDAKVLQALSSPK